MTLKEANTLVSKWHRHHRPTVGHKFSIGVANDGIVCGVAIVGRPVARMIDHTKIIEVTRLVTDGTKNACSILYAACARAAAAMGYEHIQTYTLESETGSSLRASGWVFIGLTAGGDWNTPSRGGRRTDQPMQRKKKWMKAL